MAGLCLLSGSHSQAIEKDHMPAGLFREKALNQQEERLWGRSSGLNPPGFSVLTGLFLLIALVIGLFLVAGDYTRKVRLSGILVSDRGATQVRAPDKGIIDSLRVMEGQRVGEGEILGRFRYGRITMEGQALQGNLLSENRMQADLVIKMIQETKEANASRNRQLDAEFERKRGDISRLESRLESEKQVYKLLLEKKESLETLHGKGLISNTGRNNARIDVLRQATVLERSAGEYSKSLGDLQKLKENRVLLEVKLNEDIAELSQSLSQLQQQAIEISAQDIVSLVSPVTGTIAVVFKQPGQTVLPGQPLVSVLQEGASLEAELFVPSRAVGFLDAGQVVDIRLNAFPYQKFGVRKARLGEVSGTPVLPGDLHEGVRGNELFYRARGELDRQFIRAYDKDLALRHGMGFDADVRLERRSLYEWLLMPLFRGTTAQ